MSYPTSITTFTTKNNGDVIQPSHVNVLQTEITAIETALINGFPQTFIPLTDATYDLGSAAKKFRDLFASRNALIGGTLGVTGVTTLAGLLGTSAAFSGALTAASFNGVLTVAAATGIATLTAPAGQNAALILSAPVGFAASVKYNEGAANRWQVGLDVGGSTTDFEFFNAAVGATVLKITGTAGGLGTIQNDGPLITASTTSVNNLAFATNVLMITSSGGGPFTYTITGLVAPRVGNFAIIAIVNADTNAVVLKNQDAGSTSTNRFATNTGSDITMASGETVFGVYGLDSVTGAARWRVKKM